MIGHGGGVGKRCYCLTKINLNILRTSIRQKIKVLKPKKQTMKSEIKLNKKVGRPSKATKRKFILSTRSTESERAIIKEKASKAGLAVSSYLRQAGLQTQIKSILTEENLLQIKQIISMHNDLTQLTKCLPQKGEFKYIDIFEKLRSQIDELLQIILK